MRPAFAADSEAIFLGTPLRCATGLRRKEGSFVLLPSTYPFSARGAPRAVLG
jgi:hypothetical protein